MTTIRAVVDHSVPGHLALRTVPAPEPGPSEAPVRVAAVSLNRGEVQRALSAPEGSRIGWDFAGTVVQPARDGAGPPAGARVVGMVRTPGQGAWAELIAVPTSTLAVLPESVTFTRAATLPIAGLTALQAVEHGQGLLARRVLVTGASGGCGHFAVQLARLAGALVTGLVRRPERADLVRALGAHAVVVSPDGAAAHGPYHLIVDAVGGPLLGTVLGMLAPGGACVTFGVVGEGPVAFDARCLLASGGTLYAHGLAYGLQHYWSAREGLERLVAAGHLRPHIAREAPWTEVGTVAQRLRERDFPGKAVLIIG